MITSTTRRFVTAADLEVGMVLANSRRLISVTKHDGALFTTVAWKSPSAKSGQRKQTFLKSRNVLVRVPEVVEEEDPRDSVVFNEDDEGVKWFLNEEATPYPYPEHLQAEHFPNDFHTAYPDEYTATKRAAGYENGMD